MPMMESAINSLPDSLKEPYTPQLINIHEGAGAKRFGEYVLLQGDIVGFWIRLVLGFKPAARHPVGISLPFTASFDNVSAWTVAVRLKQGKNTWHGIGIIEPGNPNIVTNIVSAIVSETEHLTSSTPSKWQMGDELAMYTMYQRIPT